MINKLKLVLENGKTFIGTSFGYHPPHLEVLGEAVFNTGMTGYQEMFTDPSYYGQILTMTYPLIGNYGITKEDFESLRPAIFGLVVKEWCEYPNNFRTKYTVSQFLQEFKIPAICDIDTRELTKIIRNHGSMKAVLVSEETTSHKINQLLKNDLPTNHVEKVTNSTPYHYQGKGPRIILINFGFKAGILRALTERNCEVIILPATTTPEEIRKYHPDGILLSNGPGDPKNVPMAIEMVRTIQTEFPIMGICLGHQIFSLANGADTYKLKFGHRGSNHPIKDLELDKIFMSSQNHGYAVVTESIPKSNLEITQVNLNDNSIEGVRHKSLPSFSVQYHPEASCGPEDTAFLFDEFLKTVEKNKKRSTGVTYA